MDFVLPKLDHTMEEGLVSKWFRSVGEPVRKGEVIVAIETNKCILDVESPETGILTGITAQEGDTVPVFGLLGTIGPADAGA